MERKIEKLLYANLLVLAVSVLFFYFKIFQSIALISVSIFLLFLNDYTIFKKTKSFYFLFPFFLLSFNFVFHFSSSSIKNIGDSFIIFIIPLLSYSLYKRSFVKSQIPIIVFIYIVSTFLFSLYFIYKYVALIPEHNYNWYLARFKIEYYTEFHGTYGSLWIGVAILMLISLYHKLNSLYKYFAFGICLIVLLLGLAIFNSRNIFINLVIITLINIYFLRKRNRFILLILLLFGCAFFLFFSQRYFDLSILDNSLRYNILKCSIKTIIESNFLAIDFNQIQPLLNSCYESNNVPEFTKFQYNSHCQYIDYTLKGSVVMLFSFIALMLFKLKHAFLNKNILYFNLTLFFIIAFLTENILVRQFGIFIYSFIDILFLGSIFVNKSNTIDKIEKT